MREYKLTMQEEKVLSKVICNGCGKEIPWETADHFHGEKTWGYFSEKDKIKMNLVVEQNNNIKIRFMKFEDYKKYINLLRYYRYCYYFAMSGEITYLDLKNQLKFFNLAEVLWSRTKIKRVRASYANHYTTPLYIRFPEYPC